MRHLFTLLLFCAVASGQPFTFNDPALLGQKMPVAAVGGAPWVPTNDATYIPKLWASAEYYYTNGSVVTLPDLGSLGNHLTNSAAAGVWPGYTASGPNGKPYISFDGTDDYLRVLFPNACPRPQELWMALMAGDNGVSDFRYFYGDYSATRPMFGQYINANQGVISLDYTTGTGVWLTNTWFVANVVWTNIDATSTKCILYTNNVIVGSYTNSSASVDLNGVVLGVRAALSRPAKFSLAEMLVYTNTIPNASDSVRSNLFWYFTNKYAISL